MCSFIMKTGPFDPVFRKMFHVKHSAISVSKEILAHPCPQCYTNKAEFGPLFSSICQERDVSRETLPFYLQIVSRETSLYALIFSLPV